MYKNLGSAGSGSADHSGGSGKASTHEFGRRPWEALCTTSRYPVLPDLTHLTQTLSLLSSLVSRGASGFLRVPFSGSGARLSRPDPDLTRT
jgi:hypothetical protein